MLSVIISTLYGNGVLIGTSVSVIKVNFKSYLLFILLVNVVNVGSNLCEPSKTLPPMFFLSSPNSAIINSIFINISTLIFYHLYYPLLFWDNTKDVNV